jgi:hypothetical protein
MLESGGERWRLLWALSDGCSMTTVAGLLHPPINEGGGVDQGPNNGRSSGSSASTADRADPGPIGSGSTPRGDIFFHFFLETSPSVGHTMPTKNMELSLVLTKNMELSSKNL